MTLKMRTISSLFLLLALFVVPAKTRAQNLNRVQGQVEFVTPDKTDKSAGVWIDGEYIGYVDELRDQNKLMLMPGEHEITMRLDGYQPATQKILVQTGKVVIVTVKLDKDPKAIYSAITAEVKLNVSPERAAVFVDDKFVGHAGEFGGAGKGMLVSPGKHHIKIVLSGYQSFETDVDVVADQKAKITTELVKIPGEK